MQVVPIMEYNTTCLIQGLGPVPQKKNKAQVQVSVSLDTISDELFVR